MAEFAAPGIGCESNHVTLTAEFGDNASGVPYALGGAGGGMALYMDKGELVYEYNMMIIERYIARSPDKIPAGKHKIEDRKTQAYCGRCALGRWSRGRPHNGPAQRGRCLYRQREFRRRNRSRFARLPGLL